MSRFTESVMNKKAKYAEKLVKNHLINTGVIVTYSPDVENKAHTFDMLMASSDKKTIMIAEVKAVNERDFYPDTGISINHYHQYLHIQKKYNLRVFIFFVDTKKGKIYGQYLDVLTDIYYVTHKGKVIEYPKIEKDKYGAAVGGSIIYFPTEQMRDIKTLTSDEISTLNLLSNKGHKEDMNHIVSVVNRKNELIEYNENIFTP